ncbi:MAG TPA: hypothetical protein VHE37_12410, partial [Nevskiaceae bacterium]|nr:hypothetical protein [Nevskiaceae bacterium]
MLGKLRQRLRGKDQVGVFKTTPDGRYLYADAALARIYRYPSPEHMMIELRDIQKQLYVDPVRRLQFIFQMGRD